jgi:hypothetical protein
MGNLRYHVVVGGGAARAYALLLGRPRPDLAPAASERYLRLIRVALRYFLADLAARSSNSVMTNPLPFV